jgi:mannose-6-phosphate isomerase-like protein (cupin superfamily)
MGKHIITKPQQESFNKVGVKGFIFPTDELTKKTEFVLIETDEGHESTIIENSCDFSYYVLSGKGYFLINEEKEECAEGDLIVIPSGTRFTYKGTLRMLLNVTPPFFPEQEETLDS